MSGPVFEPSKWNNNKYIRKSHNYYAYALDRIDMKMAKKCEKICDDNGFLFIKSI